MSTKESGEGPIEAQLRAWGAELDRLKAKADKKVAEAKKEYYEHVEELRSDIEAQLLKWSYELEELKSKVSKSEIERAVNELRGKVRAELKAFEPQIEALKAKAAKAEAEAGRIIEELRVKRRALKDDLAHLKGASEAAWKDVRAGAGRAWDELLAALRSASEKFKGGDA